MHKLVLINYLRIMLRNSNRYIELFLLGTVLFISIVAMTGWILNIPFLVSFISGSVTIKFNTALLTFLIALCAVLDIKKGLVSKLSTYILVGFVFIFSSLSLLEYYSPIALELDNLFIVDTISPNISGRMSPATSVSFILTSLGITSSLIFSKGVNRICNTFFFSVFVIAFISLITFVLFIPIEHKISFFQTMSFPTTLIFVATSTLMMFKYPSEAFKNIINLKKVGSRLFWKFIPLIILFPILISYLLLYFSSEVRMNLDFGIALSTIVFISLSGIHLIYLSIQLNTSENKRIVLEKKLFVLKENEIRITLLKETHHRVKNNFQIVNSLLGLQSNKSNNLELKVILSDCQNRIRAIAALHESIYVSGNFEVVNLDYFIKNIVSNLIEIHSDGNPVDLDIDIPNVDLNMKYAMPLGLIINEITTNSLKHAFVNQKNRVIKVHLNMPTDSHFELSIGDNGIGSDKIKGELNAPSSMGSELIAVFTDQLDGEITVENNNGLTYHLSFNVNKSQLKIA